MQHRRLAVFGVTILSAALTSCSAATKGAGDTTTSSRPATATSAPVATTTSQPPLAVPTSSQLQAELLNVASLPTGWAENSTPDTATSPCVHDIQAVANPTASVRVAFDDDGSTPVLQEVLASFTSGPNAYNTIISHENGCKNFTEVSGGQTATITMGAMSLSTVGQQSAAYSLMASADGGLYEDLIIARTGNVVMILGLGDVSPVDTSQLQQFTTQAIRAVTTN